MTIEPETFRAELAEFLDRELPRQLADLPPITAEYWGGRRPELPHPSSKRYCELMAERGLTAPTWPEEYGGGGLDKERAKILVTELRRRRLPVPLSGFGLTMIGPTLLQFGTDEQKREHLPRIARGEIRWAQGYSEPNAGSDLASLAASARIAGDEILLNGQKIWTSYADKADWMFGIFRTDTGGKKQEGITFLLLDMAQPGVEVRPIQLISGAVVVLRDVLHRRAGAEDRAVLPTVSRCGVARRPVAIRRRTSGHRRPSRPPKPTHTIARSRDGGGELQSASSCAAQIVPVRALFPWQLRELAVGIGRLENQGASILVGVSRIWVPVLNRVGIASPPLARRARAVRFASGTVTQRIQAARVITPGERM